MTDIDAAIGLVQMDYLEDWNEARIANAAKLASLIRAVETPRVREGDRHVFHQFTVRRTRRPRTRPARAAGRRRRQRHPLPDPDPPPADHPRRWASAKATFPVAEAAAESVLSLPVHPSLGPEDVEYIAATINRVCGP